ncbi:MAG: Chitinase, partial [Microbacteriaceae bacterium]|nr:Chitinase [Microbacteriaceae bacterium]
MTHAGARTDSALPPEHPHGRHIVPFRRRRVIQIVMLGALIAVIVGGVVVVGQLSSRPAAVTPPAGAAPLGSISYPAPKDALFVSPNGSDQASGTKAAPLRSVQQAITVARSGQTIVLRAGSYHQRVTVTKDKT